MPDTLTAPEVEPEIDWGEPLKNDRHEQVALLIAMENYCWSSAYRRVYSVPTEVAQKSAWALKAKFGVGSRVDYLRRAIANTRLQDLELLKAHYRNALQTPVVHVDEHSTLAQEVIKKRIVTTIGEGEDAEEVVWEVAKIKMVSKDNAGRELARLNGLYPQPDIAEAGNPLDAMLAALRTAGRPMEPPPDSRIIDVEAEPEREEISRFAAATGQA